MKKTYSGYKNILSGTASKETIEGCLVIEGGGFRGLHSQGFLDVMMREGLNLSCVIGVSAGALAGINYLSGQIGRSARINIGYRFDHRYIGLRALIHSGSVIDVGFLTEDRGITEPVDSARFNDPQKRFVAVATNCLTGKPVYFEKGQCSDIMLAARASGTIPLISPEVMIDGVPYLDGGCCMRLPFRWAMEQGYQKIIVLRTRDASFRDAEIPDRRSRRTYGKKYPALCDALDKNGKGYNRAIEELDRLSAEGRLLHLTPSKPIIVKRTERDIDKLGDLYFEGVRDAEKMLDKLKAYLKN